MESNSPFRTGKYLESKPGRWEALLERNLKEVGYPSRSKIYGSNAGLCERQTAGLLLLSDEHEAHLNAASQFYFSIGSTYETLVKRALEREGILLVDEMPIELDIGNTSVSGRIDFVIEDPNNHDMVLVELKSCGKLPTQPKYHHLAQLQTYLLLSGLPRGLLWYISRSVADYTGKVSQVVFEVEPTEDEFHQVALSLARGAIFAKEGAIPPIPAHMRKYKCGFCPLVPYCWDGEDISLEAIEPGTKLLNTLLNEADQTVKWLLDERPDRLNNFEFSVAAVTPASGKT